MTTSPTPERQTLADDRREILAQIEGWLETPMLVLGFVWLALLVWELIWGLNPILETINSVIWIIFVLNFVVEFALALHKLDYLKRNWLTALSLALPALRVFRLARVLRGARGLRLVKVVGSLNRGMCALGASMSRRGFGYVLALTAIVTLAGAAGMYAFENDNAGGGDGLNTYGEALWWTAMLMTTMGSAYWPRTAEGRVLCLILAIYAFAVFGYVTATLATFFIGRDAENNEAEVADAKSIEALRAEIRMLREELNK